MEHAAPWGPADRKAVQDVVYLCADSIRVCGILLQPFMPSKMQALLDMLGVDKLSRAFQDTKLGANRNFGQWPVDGGYPKQQGNLFPALPVPS